MTRAARESGGKRPVNHAVGSPGDDRRDDDDSSRSFKGYVPTGDIQNVGSNLEKNADAFPDPGRG